MNTHEKKIRNLESNDDTAKHVRSLKSWLLYKIKQQQIYSACLFLIPFGLFAIISKKNILIKVSPLMLYYMSKDHITMFLMQRYLLKNFETFKMRMTGDEQGDDTFDSSKSELAADLRNYLNEKNTDH